MVFVPSHLTAPNDCLSISNDEIAVSILKANLSEQNSLGIVGSKRNKFKVLIRSHCGRKKNTKKELAVTLSHLHAIRSAIRSNSTNRYALILEDDLQISFNINFPALIASAPKVNLTNSCNQHYFYIN